MKLRRCKFWVHCQMTLYPKLEAFSPGKYARSYILACYWHRSKALVTEGDPERFAMTALMPVWAVIARIQLQPELVPLLDSAAPEASSLFDHCLLLQPYCRVLKDFIIRVSRG